MNEKIPVHNSGAMPIYVAGQMIPPGETRHFDADMVPPEFRPAPAAEAEQTEPEDTLAKLSGEKLSVLMPILKDLADAELERLGELEQAKGDEARKTLLSAIAEETLRRADAAAAAAAGQGGEGEGQ